jgi:hypothetical protein
MRTVFCDAVTTGEWWPFLEQIVPSALKLFSTRFAPGEVLGVGTEWEGNTLVVETEHDPGEYTLTDPNTWK